MVELLTHIDLLLYSTTQDLPCEQILTKSMIKVVVLPLLGHPQLKQGKEIEYLRLARRAIKNQVLRSKCRCTLLEWW